MSRCKKWISKPPRWGNVNRSMSLPAGPERISAQPALSSLSQSHCPQFKLTFSCTHWYSRSSCYSWCTSGCSVSLLTGHHVHSDWSWYPFWLVMAFIPAGHSNISHWSQWPSNWSQHPFQLVTVSILIYQDIILLLVPLQWQLLYTLRITPSVHREPF